jgi:hypothetical protein
MSNLPYVIAPLLLLEQLHARSRYMRKMGMRSVGAKQIGDHAKHDGGFRRAAIIRIISWLGSLARLMYLLISGDVVVRFIGAFSQTFRHRPARGRVPFFAGCGLV